MSCNFGSAQTVEDKIFVPAFDWSVGATGSFECEDFKSFVVGISVSLKHFDVLHCFYKLLRYVLNAY